MSATRPSAAPSPWALAGLTLLLFGIWSHSFIAIGFLLGSEAVPARFDWIELTVARFLPVLVLLVPVCWLGWRRTAWTVLRRHGRRLLLCGLLAVPGYSFALYYGQEHGVPSPIASLETALAPLFLMVLGAAFLGERLSSRKVVGFAVALVGLVLIASAKPVGDGHSYAVVVMITGLAPLAWALYSALSKPVSREVHPALWAYLTLVVGTLPLVVVAPLHGARALLELDAVGWGALLFLSLLCTVFGNAAWAWLVKHLPASSVGFTIFLNPPLTTSSKALLAALLPTLFAFRIVPLEWLGSAVVLVGMAIALLRGPLPPVPVPPEGDGGPRPPAPAPRTTPAGPDGPAGKGEAGAEARGAPSGPGLYM